MAAIKIISGAQYGADLGGLLAAEKLGLETGGHCPLNCRTQYGDRRAFIDRFNLKETKTANYTVRTQLNVQNSDITLILSPNATSSGTKLTMDYCVKHDKKFILLNPITDSPDLAISFIKKHTPHVINIAGNRENTGKTLTKSVAKFCTKVFSEIS